MSAASARCASFWDLEHASPCMLGAYKVNTRTRNWLRAKNYKNMFCKGLGLTYNSPDFVEFRQLPPTSLDPVLENIIQAHT